ncbi:putative membrane protein [Nocardia transvalensis]|uniref:Putative membrane protein n=1 Tax=Nocardia transvalensis TaxID=37333 RepID=A0A7W9UMG7_9NOCA|nr:DMT family transporter [Nocardia transvalensis]MBB5917745.1 putative membrane protein [Nocardia transvalensis]
MSVVAWMLALASAVLYGLSDYVGGIASRRIHFAVTAILGQVVGLVVAVVLAAANGSGVPRVADLGWGALSGMGTALGMAALFRGLGRGTMSTVVPTSTLTGMGLPVLFGVVVEGQRPTLAAGIGIVAALPALWLVARTPDGASTASRAAVLDGLVAGVGIAIQYLALAHAAPVSGFWPVAAGRVAAVCALVPLVLWVRAVWVAEFRPICLAALAGATAALALAAYLAAAQRQLAVVAVCLSSLYPVIPVLLGITVLHERLTRAQCVGLFLATIAVVLLAV